MERFPLFMLSILLNTSILLAQTPSTIIQQFLEEHYIEQALSLEDISNWVITSQHRSSTSGVLHVYIQQQYQGIKVSNGLANFAIKDKQVLSMGNRLVSNLQQKVNATHPKIQPRQAIELAAQHLGIRSPKHLKLQKTIHQQSFIYNTGGISIEDIPVQLMYYANSDTEMKLVWELSIYTLDAQHWWSVCIDAQNGDLIHKNDWVVHCNFDHSAIAKSPSNSYKLSALDNCHTPPTVLQPDQYQVFALPVESPIHGSRSTLSNPANLLASPYGWHDTNGISGAEHTITQGNNAYAYEDSLGNNIPGFSPDGGPLLEFNFPYNPNLAPSANKSAAISNLFYMVNTMHDIWYHYGFDDTSGNFQFNNYGRGGLGGDPVLAEAQDGSAFNTASFATPADGYSPRLQMHLWNINAGDYLTVNSPASIAGSYHAGSATFGPLPPSSPIIADLVLVEDNIPPIYNGCETIVNSTQVNGKIAIIRDDAYCTTEDKILAAQNAGALAVIIISQFHAPLHYINGTNSSILIPSIRISKSDGDSLTTKMATSSVNVSIHASTTNSYPEDSDFDNGLIAHEYGHGITKRLTGGAANPNCLNNAEQMGEGWSDWFALMLTMESGDQATDPRGIANYSSRRATTGQGIRPAPYSTDFAINPYTYGASNNIHQISEPHGIGFIFATVLWDLNWALIAQYGGSPDPDLYNGTGGNNIAMNLIIESLKLQPCNPGMLDGRDAILKADSILYNNVHKCLIWNVFATRGFGYSASQGSATSRSDQVEAFDLPIQCQIPITAPSATFYYTSNTPCSQTVSFRDNSTRVPQSWLWYFGDGDSSTLQHPVHTYPSEGTYTVRLISSNTVGRDTIDQLISIAPPPAPIAHSIEICAGDTAYIPAIATGIIQWKNQNNVVVHTGDSLMISNSSTAQTYYVENMIIPSSLYIGPLNKNIGIGAYLPNNSYHGALNFTANQSIEIVSAWVFSNSSGPRTFYLVDGVNTDGSLPSGSDIIEQVTVDLNGGPQRIFLNLTVPDSGVYNIGTNHSGFFYNTSGVTYPYEIEHYMTIDSSSSNIAPNHYYYALYDLEIREPSCISAADTVTVSPLNSNFSYTVNNGTVDFTDFSVGATSWHWSFGDNQSSTLQNPSHSYALSGNYTVSLTINNGACSSTRNFSVIVGLTDIKKPSSQIVISPNPATKSANVILKGKIGGDLNIRLIDVTGKVLKTEILPEGEALLNVDLSDLPAAVYFVQIQSKAFTETKKLILR
ncbi:T9SS-dependent M36 family metallopeptidase [Aureispira anguillae]|uniref:T9SS-dependent M36 family metallopeptidase n=1 Tax=Aureispira anguillae TaxID=2864201 RepID=A0A915YCF3_9BACT|nr:T9SS-dependent M36 family metallopeptidase [Aureispira anguillae]BDS10483.1 T9SS-dependent M36 family metallopeptidase [Aureispira anguillae]